MGIHVIQGHQRSNSETDLSILKGKPDDTEISRVFGLIRAFQLVTSERTLPTRNFYTIPVQELKDIDPKEISQMRILHVLETFKCVQNKGATAADILYEATQKRDLKIMEPLLAKVSAEELNRGFELACAHASVLNSKETSLKMVSMFLKDTKLSSSALGKGFAIICNFGNSFLVSELKYNNLLAQEAIDQGFQEAYQERHQDIMEILKDKVSAQGVGQVFRKACQQGRRDDAEKLVHHPRLKIVDLRQGLMAAERHGFAGILRSALDFITRTQLFVRGHWGTLFMGGVVAGVAASMIYRNLYKSSQPSLVPLITKSFIPAQPMDDFMLTLPRCCLIK